MNKLLYAAFLLTLTCWSCGTKKTAQTVSEKRFFADDSFWNQPIAEDAETDPQSEYFIGLLKKDHSHKNFGINIKEYTIPIYEVDSSVPLVKVSNHPRHLYYQHSPLFDSIGVPIPDDFKPSPGTDKHATIVDWSRKLAWDMFLVEQDSAGNWHSCTGMVVPLDGPGVFNPADFAVKNDESIHQYGPSRAAGVPSFAGTIMYDEIMAGEINHKLACALRFVAYKQHVFPAIWTDGNFEGGIPEGAVIQLDPSLDLTPFNLTKAELVVAKALQKYGTVVVDYASGNCLYAEGLWIHSDKSWDGLLRDWDGGISSIPLDHYRVLKLENVQHGGDRKKDFFKKQLEGWEKN